MRRDAPITRHAGRFRTDETGLLRGIPPRPPSTSSEDETVSPEALLHERLAALNATMGQLDARMLTIQRVLDSGGINTSYVSCVAQQFGEARSSGTLELLVASLLR